MFYSRFSIKLKNNDIFEVALPVLESLLAVLYQNGQIYSDYKVIQELNCLTVIISSPENDSLSSKNDNKFVKKLRKNFSKLVGLELEFSSTGVSPEYQEHCCGKTSFYILYTTHLEVQSPVRCGNCFAPQPLYKIAGIKDIFSYDILQWQSNYNACDTLYINSSIGESFGLEQMSDYNSSLTAEGLAICKELSKRTASPVYYYLLAADDNIEEMNQNKRCPSCGREWLIIKQHHNKFDLKCDDCRLLSNSIMR